MLQVELMPYATKLWVFMKLSVTSEYRIKTMHQQLWKRAELLHVQIIKDLNPFAKTNDGKNSCLIHHLEFSVNDNCFDWNQIIKCCRKCTYVQDKQVTHIYLIVGVRVVWMKLNITLRHRLSYWYKEKWYCQKNNWYLY